MQQLDTNKDAQFTLRGEAMTRIETFVAAAFAFAVTMLIVSLEDVPESYEQLVTAAKLIPSFAFSCGIIMWIWHGHTKWSRRYGLEDGRAIFISCILIFVMLIYIYPLRLLMQGLFSSLSDGYFPFPIQFESYDQARFMFAFTAAGFLGLCLSFVALYAHAISQRERLDLSHYEVFKTYSDIYSWSLVSLVALAAFCMSVSISPRYLNFSGHIYFSIFPLLVSVRLVRARQYRRLITNT